MITQSEKQKLLPCPFCGGNPKLFDKSGRESPPFSIICIGEINERPCQAALWPRQTAEQAVNDWNTRTITDERRDWRPISEAPMDGRSFFGRVIETIRYLPYKDASEQARLGIKGRWQRLNEYGGWENALISPNEWIYQEEFIPPTAAGDLE